MTYSNPDYLRFAAFSDIRPSQVERIKAGGQEDPDRIGHVMEIGTYIGKNWGKVTQIKPEEIVITEEYRDPIENELIINEITMRLPDPAEGDKKD